MKNWKGTKAGNTEVLPQLQEDYSKLKIESHSAVLDSSACGIGKIIRSLINTGEDMIGELTSTSQSTASVVPVPSSEFMFMHRNFPSCDSTQRLHDLIFSQLWHAFLNSTMASPPLSTLHQDTVTALLSLCMGYMVYDFIFMLTRNN